MEMVKEVLVVDGKQIGEEALLSQLARGAQSYHCGDYLYNLDAIARQQIYHELEAERLRDKYEMLQQRYISVKQDWNQLFFIMFMRSLSDMVNKECYVELAMRIGYSVIQHERSSLESVEALFICASGLHIRLSNDEFSRKATKVGEHLMRKYNITPLSPSRWNLKRANGGKDPLIRLLQAARFFCESEHPFNSVINCRSRNDVLSLFNVAISERWSGYFGEVAWKIGVEKCDILGINFVVPLMSAYSLYTSDDELASVAADLNESLPAESNLYISGWKRSGLTLASAYESQALIQLKTIYCMAKRCSECILFRHMTSPRSILSKIPLFVTNAPQ